MSSERPSPFTVPVPHCGFTEGPASQPQSGGTLTVGLLIRHLTDFAAAYERLTVAIEGAEDPAPPVLPATGSGGMTFRVCGLERHRAIFERDLYVSTALAFFTAAYDIDRVRGYVLSQSGDELTIGTARRLLGELLKRRKLKLAEAEALTLAQAIDSVESPPHAPPEDRPDTPAVAGFLHHSNYLPSGEANRPEAVWPHTQRQRAAFGRRVAVANDKLAAAGARLPDAFTAYWIRHWADSFWRATRHGPPSVPGVQALIDFGDVIDAQFRLRDRHGDEPCDAEFTYYDRELLRGDRPSTLGPHGMTSGGGSATLTGTTFSFFMLSPHGKTLERDGFATPVPFPRLATPAPALALRIGCEEFLAWAGFLARDSALTPEQRAELNRVGVYVGGWCVANGGDVTDCDRIAKNLIHQLRQFTNTLSRKLTIGRAVLPADLPLPGVPHEKRARS